MKLLKKPLFLNILLFLIITLIVAVGYYGFIHYRTMTVSARKNPIAQIIPKMTQTLDKLDAEYMNSSAYLATRSKSNYLHMIESQKSLDDALYNLRTVMGTAMPVERYMQLKDALSHTREEMENAHTHPYRMLYQGYHESFYLPLVSLFDKLTVEQPHIQLQHYLRMYRKIVDLQEQNALEGAIIYGILLKGTPIDTRERQWLENLFATDRLSSFKVEGDALTSVELNAVLSADTYNAMLQKEHDALLEGAKSGHYNIDIIAWLGAYQKRIDYFHSLEHILQQHIEKVTQEEKANIQINTILYGVTLFLLFYLLFKLIGWKRKLLKETSVSDKTLRDIGLVFNEDEYNRLKALTEKGNVEMLYRFMMETVEHANRTKDLFLAGMSHEIRTPLNGILGFTQLLKETELTSEQEELLSVVEKSSDHLLRIVNDILDLSKIKANRMEMEKIAFDPLETFETAVETYAGKAHSAEIDMHVFIDPKLPTSLIGDPTKLSQVLVNLLSNAVKFTPKQGSITVRIELFSEHETGATVGFSVEDTGIGISPEERKTIFQAFSQADASTSRKYGGTGLGLSISGKLVEAMGGKLGIRSIPKEGSTFHFSLELEKAPDAQRRKVDVLKGFRIGILNAHQGLEYFINRDLEAYLQFMGAEMVEHFTERKLLWAKEKGLLPDILFIDHKHRQRDGELEKYLDLGCRTILLSTIDQKRELEKYAGTIDKILYKPVTFTKTYKAVSGDEESRKIQETLLFEDVRVLVAEDNSINQRLITNVLSKLGIDVEIAEDGLEALEFRKRKRYDMIFMDIEMPVMGGMEATVKIRSFEREKGLPHIPIVALTANALSGDRAKYLGVGMDDYMAKPIKLDALRDLFSYYFGDKVVETKVS